MGFPVTLCMPSNVSPERKKYLAAYGANIVWTSPADGSDGAIRKARELVAAHPDLYFYADQYSNEQNWLSHYHHTAPEIWRQTEGQVTHFVAGSAPPAPSWAPPAACASSTPASSASPCSPTPPSTGSKASSTWPPPSSPASTTPRWPTKTSTWKPSAPTPCACASLAAPACWSASLPVGAAAAALQIAEREHAAGREAVIVTILCDSAEKYMSERFWQEGLHA